MACGEDGGFIMSTDILEMEDARPQMINI